MAPSALAECVKIEVSHDVGRQPGRQRLKSVICDSEPEWKGCRLGKMRTQMMCTSGKRLTPAATLESAAGVMKSRGSEDYV